MRSRVFLALFLSLLGSTLASAASPRSLTWVSRAIDGGPALTGAESSSPSVSSDGRYVAFTSNALNFGANPTGVPQVWVKDRQTGEVRLASASLAGDGTSGAFNPAITVVSGDGQVVAFSSLADNLIFGDADGREDAFALERLGTVTDRVSAGPGGVEGRAPARSYGSAVSPDGR